MTCLECQVHIDYAEQMAQDIEQLNYRLRKIERENYKLRTVNEERAVSAKLGEDTKEFLATWIDLRRRLITDARKVAAGLDSSRAKQYQNARKNWSHEELMACLQGVALSDFHTSDKRYFEPGSFLKEDKRIEQHIARWDNAERLREAGFTDENWIRQNVQKPPDPTPSPFEAEVKCPGCGDYPCRCHMVEPPF